jgi:NADPH:quinone reductase-like Zn-dependent oxidoreductase
MSFGNERAAWHRPGRDLTWNLDDNASAVLQDVVWSERPSAEENLLPEDMVEISSHAFGLNLKDVMMAMDTIRDAEYIGHENAGIITRIGAAAASKGGLRVGQRVCGVFQGRFSTTAQTP